MSKIKNLREQAGLTQEALARELGVSRQTVINWETGRNTPFGRNAKIVADFFGVTIDELY